VMDVSGKQVLTINTNLREVNLNELSSGVYALVVLGNNTSYEYVFRTKQ
jgi:hypothetical protein